MRFQLVLGASLVAIAAQAQDYTRYQGSWQGDFLFYFAQEDTGAQGQPSVHAGALRIEDDGSVQGTVPAAACKLSGTSAEYISPANATLALTFSGCRDDRFNGRFSGRLINNPILKYASIRLNGVPSLDAGTAQVSAIVRH